MKWNNTFARFKWDINKFNWTGNSNFCLLAINCFTWRRYHWIIQWYRWLIDTFNYNNWCGFPQWIGFIPNGQHATQLARATDDLNKLISHVSCFVNWWLEIVTNLTYFEHRLPQLEADGSNPMRARQVREQWVKVGERYLAYSKEVSHGILYTSWRFVSILKTVNHLDQGHRGQIQTILFGAILLLCYVNGHHHYYTYTIIYSYMLIVYARFLPRSTIFCFSPAILCYSTRI